MRRNRDFVRVMKILFTSIRYGRPNGHTAEAVGTTQRQICLNPLPVVRSREKQGKSAPLAPAMVDRNEKACWASLARLPRTDLKVFGIVALQLQILGMLKPFVKHEMAI